jgi:hypothetical protein
LVKWLINSQRFNWFLIGSEDQENDDTVDKYEQLEVPHYRNGLAAAEKYNRLLLTKASLEQNLIMVNLI